MKNNNMLHNLKFTYKITFIIIPYIVKYEEQLNILNNNDIVTILSLSRQNTIKDKDKVKLNTKNIYMKENIELLLQKYTYYYIIGRILDTLKKKMKILDIIDMIYPTFKAYSSKLEKEKKYIENKKKKELENIELKQKIKYLKGLVFLEGI